MHNSHNFRVGFQQFANRCPETTKPGRDSFLWYLEESRRLGTHALSMMLVDRIPDEEKYDAGFLEISDMGYVREMAACAKEADVDYVCYCAGLHSLSGLPHPVFGPQKMTVAQAHRSVERMLEVCEIFGIKTLGGGYGRLNFKTGRYNSKVPYAVFKEYMAANLSRLGRLLEGTDIMMAYENHCDFSGKEIAELLETVNHPNIAAMYDVGNAASVLLDPNDDIDYLAPWAVAMHFKDMKVIDNPVFEHLWQDMPVIYKGCLLGEGIIDFDRVMTAVCEKALRKQNMPILSEPAFILPENHYNCLEEMHQFDRECTYQFVDFMQKLVDRY